MNCPRCGQPISDTDRSCPHCSAVIKTQSFWQKLLALFIGSGRGPLVRINRTVTVNKVNVVTNQNGERHEYKSLEEVPPELRSTIENALKDASHASKVTKTFRVRDASGQEHVYHSLDEMPSHLRGLVERAQHDSKSPPP